MAKSKYKHRKKLEDRKGRKQSKKAKKREKKSLKRKREEEAITEGLDEGGVELVHSDPLAQNEIDAAPAVSAGAAGAASAASSAGAAPATEPSQKVKKRKKTKHEKNEDEDEPAPGSRKDEQPTARTQASRDQAVTERDGHIPAKDTAEEAIQPVDVDMNTGNGVPLTSAKPEAAPEDTDAALTTQPVSDPSKRHRFIVFVGNLPYNATTESIRAHFSSLEPSSIRHATHKDDPSRSKGFAFLEFDGYARMDTCLRKFHHSNFEDGSGKARKINVELTAGGGGKKSEARHSKLAAKNKKLNEERKRRAEKEAAESKTEDAKANGAKDKQGEDEEKESSIHPSRRNRVRA